MTTVVFLLEEPSAKVLLQGLVPRLLGDGVLLKYLVFEGKQDLEKQLAAKIRYWQQPNSVFVVLRDQDVGDCRQVKAQLVKRVTESGRPALVRVACRELEAWIAGDLEALSIAYDEPRVAEHAGKRDFRAPDRLHSPINRLRALVPDYQKVDGARRLGPLLSLDGNRSESFNAFCEGLKRLVGPR